MVRHKADDKYEDDAEYVTAGFLLDQDRICSGLEVRLEDFPRDSGIEYD